MSNHRTSIVVGFAGHARSGKTSVADAAARQTGLSVARFGQEVERVARGRGLPLDSPETRRATLMAVGAELVAGDVVDFCRAVLAQGDWEPGRSLLVEGVRHARVADVLRTLVAPTPFHLVLVTTAAPVREVRLAAEGVAGADALARLDAHSTERDVTERLPDLASLTIGGEGDVDVASAAVVASMHAWGWRL